LINEYKAFEAFEGQYNCAVSGALPAEPRSLGFCHKFNEKACCPPVMDDENTEMFNMLTGVGLSCRIRGDIRQDPLAKWYCLNCDPEQPRYIRPAPHDPVDYGDFTCPTDGRDQTLLVCKDWAEEEFGINPILVGPSQRFEDCALLKSSPCLDHNGEAIDDRDRYMCGDDPVYPSSYTYTDADGKVDTTLSLEGFMNADDMGPPVLNENYYFKLVDKELCDEDYLVNLYAGLDGSAGDQPQPLCLRNAAQLRTTTYDFGSLVKHKGITFAHYYCDTDQEIDCSAVSCGDGAGRAENACCCAEWHDQLCFGGAMGTFVPSPAFFTLAAALILLLL
jgi:hypothetical protein